MTDYIYTELLVLIPVLYLIGIGIKKSALPNKFIPFLLGAAGICLAGLYVFASSPIETFSDVLAAIFATITQGVLCAGASVYADQLYKQAKKDE